MNAELFERLQALFGAMVERDVPLAPFTSARVGGPADVLITVRRARELALVARRLWEMDVPFLVLGGGSNVLVADAGVRGVVVLNRSKQVAFDRENAEVWAESGVNLGSLARRAAQQGLAGLEWAAGIPGTVGGAVVGNAGAHGGDISSVLKVAEILQRDKGKGFFTPDELGYDYRTSILKQNYDQMVVLSATFKLRLGDPAEIQSEMDEYRAQREKTQPPGASMGSMFKNPPGDYAGRLIEAAGLKGASVGDAEISTLHANFFINNGHATANEILALMDLARSTVAAKFGVWLEPEIVLVGEWPAKVRAAFLSKEPLPADDFPALRRRPNG